MIIQTEKIAFNIEVDETALNKSLIPVIFLHGFTGSSSDWKFIFNNLNSNFLPVAIDLIGHGHSDSPSNAGLYTAGAISNQLDQLFIKLHFNKIIICGYSMGGRAALAYYSNYLEKVAGLILESSTPGIEETDSRNERIKHDNFLALKIKEEGVEKFCSYWLNMPIFESLKSLPPEKYQNILKSKIQNNPVGLINSLKSFGTGTMPSFWKIIETINLPVLLLTGKYDDKFTGINERMNKTLKHSEHCIVNECGHNVHLEKPEEFCNLVNKYLTDNIF
jgi:2-succinyl-6-hydroxy-2,4-cyclohexadiene-1-carboxylate synthase